MGLKEVKQFFEQHNKADDVIVVDDSSATVSLAAQALGVEEARIAKSLTFQGKEEAFMIVMAGDAKIDNRKYKDRFKTKAKMLTAEEVEGITGHEVGGICPFAIKDSTMKVFLDDSLKRFDTVFPACGSAQSAIELTIPELEEYGNCYEWIDVTKIQ